jgi:hypothetical protein
MAPAALDPDYEADAKRHRQALEHFDQERFRHVSAILALGRGSPVYPRLWGRMDKA